MECNFCKKIFSNIYTLNNHKATAKYCLKIQNKTIAEKFKCELCGKIFTTKYVLNTHSNSCKEESIINDKQKDIIIETYKKQEKYHKQQIKKQEEQIRELQDKLERLATTAISKPSSTTTNNNNTKILLMTPLDLSHERISNIVTNKLCGNHIVDGMAGIAKFVKDEIISSEDGSLLYGCADASRQVFKYKNKEGDVVKDQKATKLIGAIQPALKEKTNNMYFEYGNKIKNYVEDEEDKNNIFSEKDKCAFLKDTALKIHEDISDMHQNAKFCTELANQVTT